MKRYINCTDALAPFVKYRGSARAIAEQLSMLISVGIFGGQCKCRIPHEESNSYGAFPLLYLNIA